MPVKPLPPVLFKYYPPERIDDVLSAFSLRFSSPSTFNDAFDAASVSVSLADAVKPKERLSGRSNIGVLCLTESPDNHLMWVNYAAQHKGFVVGLRSQHSFFNDSRPREVTYVPRPVILPVNPDPIIERMYYKSKDWIYEQEWRCVRYFSSRDSRDIDFEPSLISAVILGWKMESYHVAHVLDLVSLINLINESPSDSIAVSESRPDMKTWKFRHRPVSKALCEQCNGVGYIKAKAAAQP